MRLLHTGMLIAARDIVMRLPEADEGRIKAELSGNLCRCTGYLGVVKAVRKTLEAPGFAPRVLPASPDQSHPEPRSAPSEYPRGESSPRPSRL